MFPRGAFDPWSKRKRSCGTDATSDAIAGLVHADLVKTLVMTISAGASLRAVLIGNFRVEHTDGVIRPRLAGRAHARP